MFCRTRHCNYIYPMQPFFVHPDIAEAKTLDKSFYLNPEYFALSRDKLFRRSWLWLCHNADLDSPNNCKPATLMDGFLDEPVLITKTAEGKMHCLSNVCTHRGAQLLQAPCKANNIRCPYHGRQFALDGQFKGMPEFQEVRNFPTEADHLYPYKFEKLIGNFYLNPSGTALFHDYFGPMLERLHWLPFDSFVLDEKATRHFEVKANWALYCENYLEGFHIPFVHPALNQALDFGSYNTELFAYSSLQLGVAKAGEIVFDQPPSSVDYGQQIAAYYYFIFPNLMFNFYPWGLSLNVVTPKTIDTTTVSFYRYTWQPNLLGTGAGADVDSTELEDEAVVESVQVGIRSPHYQHGRYSVRHEKGTHHFHRIIAQMMHV